MQAFGVLLLAAATAGQGFGFNTPDVGLKPFLRPHAVVHGDVPGPPPYTAANLAGGGPGATPGRRFVTTKSQIYFLDPNGMLVGWQNGTGPQGERTYLPAQLTVPARYNFNQGFIYRLKITNIPGRPTVSLYPTIGCADDANDRRLPGAQCDPGAVDRRGFRSGRRWRQLRYQGHLSARPQVSGLAVSGVETLVSTRLEPGVDPILEADKRGTILLILRLGAIDLETPVAQVSGAVVGPPVVGVPTELAPGALPPGATVVAPPAQPTVNLDSAPVSGVPATPVPAAAPAPAPAPVAPAVPAPPPAGEPAKPKTAALAPPVSAPELAPAPGS